MDGFEILPMREESISEILKLADEGGLAPWTEADYLAELVRDGAIALEIREIDTLKTRGFIVARLITKSNNPDHSQAEILNITVDSDYRKLGLASALIRQVTETISEYSPADIWLEVRCSNTGAIRFYEKHGFTREYIRKNFYSNPAEDGLVMKMEIYG